MTQHAKIGIVTDSSIRDSLEHPLAEHAKIGIVTDSSIRDSLEHPV